MRKLFLLLTILFMVTFSIESNAQNIEVVGYQSGTWDADTVFVTGNVSVEDSLYIQAGTIVMFQGYFGIRVDNGTFIKALGTETDSIVFTVSDTTGFHLFNSGRGGWDGIHLDDARASRFDYCRFEYGKAALDDDQDGGALRITGCNDVEISHSTLFCNFSREHGGALNAEHSKVVLHDCDVRNNLTYTEIDTVYFMYGGGLRFINCEVELTKTDFRYNNGMSAIGGALSIDSCAARIDRCRFEHNYGINGGGLYLIRSNDWDCSITNSLFANNTSGHFGGGLAICESSPLMANLTVADNQSIGVNCGGIFFYQHSSPAVWNCIVYGNGNDAPLEEPVQMWTWTYDDYAPEFHNCLVQFGLENISNNEVIQVYENCIDEDPLFRDNGYVDDRYTIWLDSPCFDAGSPDTPIEVLEGYDLWNQPRVWGGIIDIGAFEVDPTGIPENTQNRQNIRIAGNPITPNSYAEITLDKACRAQVSVYSLEGKLLYSKDCGTFTPGVNHITVGGLFQGLSKGTYLLVVKAGGQTYSVKVIVK